MEIIIEIGTDQQRELIYQELLFFREVATELSPLQAITKIIVPQNFDATINSLQNTNHYKSDREGNLAVAKIVPKEKDVAIVFSPLLYTDEHDNHTRMQIYTHELFHVISKELFPKFQQKSEADLIYFKNIYILYDEYYANRRSYEVTEKIFMTLSHRYKKSNALRLKSFIDSVSRDCEYYRKIKDEISKFRFHADVDLYLRNTENTFDAAAKSLIYIWSYFDHNPRAKRLEPLLNECHFWCDQTKPLIKYFGEKYMTNDFNLISALDLIEEFMSSFGVRFENMKDGRVYCHILDI